MPPFPERESSILAKLKKKKGPGNLPDIDDVRRNVNGSSEHSENTEEAKKVTVALSWSPNPNHCYAFCIKTFSQLGDHTQPLCSYQALRKGKYSEKNSVLYIYIVFLTNLGYF